MPIFDQGYQHWNGTLAGHSWRWLAIARHGVRAGMKIRVMRLFLLVAWLPALLLGLALCVWGLLERKSETVAPMLQFLRFLEPEMLAEPRRFRVEVWTICYDYFLLTELRLAMVLVLLIGPNLISQDLRFNALPLYFSRPLRRIDYFLGKLGVVAAFIALVTIVPAIVAYALGLLFSLDFSILRDTLPLLLSAIAYGGVIALSAGLLVLALSSLSRNSRYVALFWLGIWVVTSMVGHVLQKVDHDQRRHDNFARTAVLHRPPSNVDENGKPLSSAEIAARHRAWVEAFKQADERIRAEQIEAARSDWRPVISYTANLSRVGQHLLGTNRRWESLAQLRPPDQRQSFLFDYMGPQYPWYWSAGVLAGLFGLSACVLNLRVKSLDRLR